MVKFDEPFHASTIPNDCWDKILESCDFLKSVDLDATRFELGKIRERYENPDDEVKDEKNKPTEFQGFVKACAIGFGMDIIQTFYNKVQKTLILANKTLPKVKVTANTT